MGEKILMLVIAIVIVLILGFVMVMCSAPNTMDPVKMEGISSHGSADTHSESTEAIVEPEHSEPSGEHPSALVNPESTH